MFAGETYQDD
ncbi:rCG48788 [Rattus norvegicus]|uniref:RCG48788 n=1 Tax=Rattus norvegicus TaxID=10116 RepID=A6IGX9_RAT|nr:rCG48788 [Rattus norvegicus]